MNNNLPLGAQYDKSAPFNWDEETEVKIQDEAQFFIADNLVDCLLSGYTIEEAIEEAICEGLSLCDEETQDIYQDWAFNELRQFLEGQIENKLTRIKF